VVRIQISSHGGSGDISRIVMNVHGTSEDPIYEIVHWDSNANYKGSIAIDKDEARTLVRTLGDLMENV